MMLDVARHGDGSRPVSLGSVSQRTGLSRGYLEQVAATLHTARLLRSFTGRHGGYRLARLPQHITIADIVEATIGPVCLVDCLEDPENCPHSAVCECRVVYALINHRISEILYGYTLADLLDPSWVRSVGGEVARLTAVPRPGAGGETRS